MKPPPLLRYIRQLGRHGSPLASCVRCRCLIFAVDRDGTARLMDPGARVGLTFLVDLGRAGMAWLKPQCFAPTHAFRTAAEFVADDPRPHQCPDRRPAMRSRRTAIPPAIPAGRLADFELWIYASLGRAGAERLLRVVMSRCWGYSRPGDGAVGHARLTAGQFALVREKATELVEALGGEVVVDGMAWRCAAGRLVASLPS